jgi:membrane associated rhomboid family serine protease
MFPIRDENPTLHTSFMTFAIIGINIAVWVFVQGLGFNPRLAASICEYGLIPGELLKTIIPGTALPLGDGLACIVQAKPDWWTVITSMFMHGGWFHIVGNMWFLAIFGDNIEDALGPVRFVVFYFLCGIAAVAAQMISDPSSAVPMVGASGAISGVMGAYAFIYPRVPVHMLVFVGFFFFRVIVPAYLVLGYWFILQVLGSLPALAGMSGGVAFWAHIGGFLTGIILVSIMCDKRRVETCRRRRGTISGITRWIR